MKSMFSGIVETTSPILAAKTRGACRRVSIRTPARWELAVGESISVDGICSTVIARSSRSFEVEYMPATLSKTTAGAFRPRRAVNLERSLRWSGRVHGHFVAGHVDARGKIVLVNRHGRARSVAIAVPRALARLARPRGSIAVNGVSLTIVRAARGRIEVALIPHTLRATNLGALRQGDRVNIECDMLARYAPPHRGGRVKRHAKKRARRND